MIKAEPRVASLERGMKVLTCFLGEETRLTLTDIAGMTGFYKSTTLRLCATLQDGGFLYRDAEGLYSLGPLIGELGNRFSSGDYVNREAVVAELMELGREFGETVAFYVPIGSEQMCLIRIESDKLVRAAIQEGQRIPIGKEASGQVIDATRGKSGKIYDEIRKTKTAVSVGAVHSGATGVATPVLRPSGEIVGVLTIIGPSERLGAKTISHMKSALMLAARRLEAV